MVYTVFGVSWVPLARAFLRTSGTEIRGTYMVCQVGSATFPHKPTFWIVLRLSETIRVHVCGRTETEKRTNVAKQIDK